MSLGYRPEIDGLRTLAVVPVVLFHAGLPGITGGYVGVDIFFVISGFLITAIIAREVAAGQFSILTFYERRARRILPAMTVVVLATLAAAAAIQTPPRFEETALSAGAAAVFLSNVYFYLQLDYFGVAAEYRPLLHTWSLAVEEQFYLLWPVALILLGASRPKARAMLVYAVLVLSFVAAVWATSHLPSFSFYMLPTRAWELMLGAALALGLIPAPRSKPLAEAGAALGLALIAFALFTYDKSTSFPGLAALPPCLGAALIILAGGETRVGKLLSWGPIVFVGLVSYSLYLWHWPPLALLRIINGSTELPLAMALGASLLAFGLAVLSWRFVERPFRSKEGFGRGAIFAFSTASIVGIAAFAGAIKLAEGLPGRFNADLYATYLESTSNGNMRQCRNRVPQDSLCRIGETTAEPTVLVWGDSHVGSALAALEHTLSAAQISGVAAWKAGCMPAPAVRRAAEWQDCARFKDAVLALVTEGQTSIDTVVLVGRWALAATGERSPGEAGRDEPLQLRGSAAPVTSAEAFAHGMTDVVGTLIEAGMQVVVLGGVPEIGRHVPDQWLLRQHLGLGPIPAPSLADAQARDEIPSKVLTGLAQNPNVTYLPVLEQFCTPECATVADGKPLYIDDDHLSRHGSVTLLAPVLAPVFPAVQAPAELPSGNRPLWSPPEDVALQAD